MTQPLGSSSSSACCIRHPQYLWSVSIKVFCFNWESLLTGTPSSSIPPLPVQMQVLPSASVPQDPSHSSLKQPKLLAQCRAEDEGSKALPGGSIKKGHMCLCKCCIINRAVTIQASQTSCFSNQIHWQQLFCSHYADTVRATNSSTNQGLI